jgi:hypothetical protein
MILACELGVVAITCLFLFSDARHPNHTASSHPSPTGIFFVMFSCLLSLLSFAVSVVGLGRVVAALRHAARRVSGAVADKIAARRSSENLRPGSCTESGGSTKGEGTVHTHGQHIEVVGGQPGPA